MNGVSTKAPRASRKNDILECFTDMVALRGYDEVSLRDVAEFLGISKGTIVHHFGSKDRMLELLHANYMTRRLAELRAIFEQVHSPVGRVSAIVHQLMLAERDDRSATVAFGREIVRFAMEDQMKDVRAMRDEYTKMTVDTIRSGVSQGIFKTDHPEIVALQVFGMCNWSWTWFRPEGMWSADEVADTFVNTLLGGLCPSGVADFAEELDGVPMIVHRSMVPHVSDADGADVRLPDEAAV
jgi:AcrR family transcriptional regulator